VCCSVAEKADSFPIKPLSQQRLSLGFAGLRSLINQHPDHALDRGPIKVASPLSFIIQNRQATIALALNPYWFLQKRPLIAALTGIVMRDTHNPKLLL
jgi:hypothetical protein